MAFPKRELFPEFDQRVGVYGRATGHPARNTILRLLEDEGPKRVMDLVQLLPLSEGTITEHLKKLRGAGLVTVEIRGLMNYYTVDKDGLRVMRELQDLFFTMLGMGKMDGVAVKADEIEIGQ